MVSSGLGTGGAPCRSGDPCSGEFIEGDVCSTVEIRSERDSPNGILVVSVTRNGKYTTYEVRIVGSSISSLSEGFKGDGDSGNGYNGQTSVQHQPDD